MSTPEGLCNLALAKLGLADRISSLAAPRLPLERHFSTIYPHYRDVELRRRRWVFAKMTWTLAQIVQDTTDPDRPFVYNLPDEVINPWRDKDTEWLVVGRQLWSGYPVSLVVTGNKRVDPYLFDPLFDEVLVTRLAIESLDKPGVPDSKRQDAKQWYVAAVNDAAAGNAFLHEPDDIADDNKFDWLTARN